MGARRFDDECCAGRLVRREVLAHGGLRIVDVDRGRDAVLWSCLESVLRDYVERIPENAFPSFLETLYCESIDSGYDSMGG